MSKRGLYVRLIPERCEVFQGSVAERDDEKGTRQVGCEIQNGIGLTVKNEDGLEADPVGGRVNTVLEDFPQ